MALLTAAALANVLTQQFAPRIQSQINNSCVLLSQLDVKEGAGQVIAFSARFPRSVLPAAFAEGDDVGETEFQSDTRVPATLPWARYRAGIKLSGLSEDVAASANGSPEEVMNLFESELDDAIEHLTSKINKDLWSGAGTGNTIAGLVGGGVLAATGSYAGLLQSTYSLWAAQVSANGGTPRALTKTLVDGMETSLFNAAPSKSDLIIASPDIAQKYESLFDATIRQRPVNLSEGRADLAVMRLSDVPGDTGLSYKGIPVFRDKDAPAGTFSFLNRKYLHVKTLPMRNRQMADAVAEDKGRTLASEGTRIPLHVKIEPLGKTGDSRKFQIVVTLQLVCTRRNGLGHIKDLS